MDLMIIILALFKYTGYISVVYCVSLTPANNLVQPQLMGWNLMGKVLEGCVGAGVILRVNVLANAR